MPKDNTVGSEQEQSPEQVRNTVLVSEPSAEYLTQRQQVDYAEHKESLVRWMLNVGKDPERAIGYSEHTASGRSYYVDAFFRWLWDKEGYTLHVTHDHADDYMQHLAYSEGSQDYKANHMKALKMYFRWRAWEFGEEEWEPEITFSGDNSTTNPRDYLSVEERQRVREAALEYGSVPAYNSLSPAERNQWKIHLAQRFGKAKKDVGPEDFERANGWKIPSLVWTALDTGLRPIEVERAKVQWVDTDAKVLRIPKEESSKNADNWVVSLTDRTASALSRWLSERENYGRYDGRDALWLTREGNPYGSQALNRILMKLCKIAEIPTENRDVTWYSIRHSVGTYMTRAEGLAAAQAQLRHKSPQTTMRYDQVPIEDRRGALDKMG